MVVKTFLKRVFARNGYVVRKRPRLLAEQPAVGLRFDLGYILAHLLLRCPDPFVVQVGAYDGVANDPLNPYIRRFRLSGLLIEPQPVAFAELTANYADQPQLILCRAAVADRDGSRDMYRLAGDGARLPEWAAQMATFRKDFLLAQRRMIPDVERYITADPVPCRTFDSLFRQYGVGRVDVLHVDAEGYDYEVLKLFPFDRFAPALVRYEHHHLPAADQDACLRMLAGLGYSLFVPDQDQGEYMDTVAYRPGPLPAAGGAARDD